MSIDYGNQTTSVPQSLLGVSNSNQSININSTNGIVFNDSVANLSATIAWTGITTNNPNGFNIQSKLNMNSNDITNVGTITATSFNGTASNANNVTISDNNTGSTFYPTFASTNSGNLPLYVDKTTSPLSYVPSTGNLSATTFTGALSGNATSCTNANNIATTGVTNNATYYLPFVSSTSTSTGQSLYTDQNGHITFNPSTNQLSTDGTMTNNGLTMNGSASQFLINNASASVPAISAPNAQLISFPNANVTASIFSGNLSGNSTTSTIASKVVISTETGNTNFDICMTTGTSGNLAIGDVSTLYYNPSTSTLTNSGGTISATNFSGTTFSGTTFNGSVSNASTIASNSSGALTITGGSGGALTINSNAAQPINLQYNGTTIVTVNSNNITMPSGTTMIAPNFSGLLDTCGLVYLQTLAVAITGTATTVNFNLTSIFNSTYKNYRVIMTPSTQLSYAQYPSYSLQAFLGTSVPTLATLAGNEITSSSTSSVSPLYTGSATISSAPIIFGVSSTINHPIIFEVENVGYTYTATQLGAIKCKSIYSNPGVSGYSDRNIFWTSSTATITGLTIQQASIGVGNNLTMNVVVYGYK